MVDYVSKDKRGRVVAFSGGAPGPFSFIDADGRMIEVGESAGDGGGGGTGTVRSVEGNMPDETSNGDVIIFHNKQFVPEPWVLSANSYFLPVQDAYPLDFTFDGNPYTVDIPANADLDTIVSLLNDLVGDDPFQNRGGRFGGSSLKPLDLTASGAYLANLGLSEPGDGLVFVAGNVFTLLGSEQVSHNGSRLADYLKGLARTVAGLVASVAGMVVVPRPGAADAGKVLIGHADGTYTLEFLPADVDEVPDTAPMGDETGYLVASPQGATNQTSYLSKKAFLKPLTDGLAAAVQSVTDAVARILNIENRLVTGTKIIAAAPGEAGLRAALVTAAGYLATPGAFVIVDVPAQADINLAASISIDSQDSSRVFIRAPAWDAIPAPSSIASAVATGAVGANGVALYDVTFNTATAHGLAAGDNIVLVGRTQTGTPTGAWQALPGYHRVRAVPTATQVTFRIPSSVALTNIATALSGANSIAMTMHRVKAHLIAPVNAPAISITNSRILGFANLGLEGTDIGVNAVPLYVVGTSTLVATSGAFAVRGGAVGVNVLNFAQMRWGSPSTAVIASTDYPIAFTGQQIAIVPNVGTVLDASMATSVAVGGCSSHAIFCQSALADFPRLGTYGGNVGAALSTLKQSRNFFRIVTLPGGVGNNGGQNGFQLFLDSSTLVDAQGTSGISVNITANQLNTANGCYISV